MIVHNVLKLTFLTLIVAVLIAKSIRPSTRLDANVVVATQQLEDVDRKERQTSLDQANDAG